MGCAASGVAQADVVEPRSVSGAKTVRSRPVVTAGSSVAAGNVPRELTFAERRRLPLATLAGNVSWEASAGASKALASSSDKALTKEYVVGSAADHYNFHEQLGSGAMGAVQRATCRSSGDALAVKVMKTTRHTHMELELLARLSHPNIIRFVEGFESATTTYLVMEMCCGGDLLDHVKEQGSLAECDAAGLMRQMVIAVAYSHSRLICHRDLKLENFMLATGSSTGQSTVKLVDFGLACTFKPGRFMTETLGTLTYMAPEVLRKRYTEKCDMWSLGCALYVMLRGSEPYQAEDEKDLINKVRAGAVREMVGVKWKRISLEGKSFIAHLMHGNMWARYSAEQALQDCWINIFAPPTFTIARSSSSGSSVVRQPMEDDFVKIKVALTSRKGPGESRTRHAWSENLILDLAKKDIKALGAAAHDTALRSAAAGEPCMPDVGGDGRPVVPPGCVEERPASRDTKYSAAASGCETSCPETPLTSSSTWRTNSDEVDVSSACGSPLRSVLV